MSRSRQGWPTTGMILLAGLAVLTACAGSPGTSEPIDPVGTWGDPAAANEPSLELAADGALAGTDGCNRLMGTWSDDGETITFSDIATTRMYCEGVDTWLAALATGTLSGETLTVLDSDGDEIGTLERSSSDEPDLDDLGDDMAFLGTWGTESVGQPHLVITEAGSVTGSDGCNRLTGSWATTDDAGIEFTGVASTLMACEGVDTWLSGLASATVDGDTLTVFDGDGTELGTLQRSA